MAKAKLKPDPKRDRRIANEIVVDAYGSEERALSWYYYLEEQLTFPFTATWFTRHAENFDPIF